MAVALEMQMRYEVAVTIIAERWLFEVKLFHMLNGCSVGTAAMEKNAHGAANSRFSHGNRGEVAVLCEAQAASRELLTSITGLS